MSQPLLLAHLNLDVADLERSVAFYGQALELPVTRSNGTARVVWESFLLVLASGTPNASADFHFGFRVDSSEAVDAWAQRLRERGIALASEPARRGAVYVFRVADPDAYVIEIFAFVA
ncbi:MAG: hypothetical protein NVS2B3_02460 [Vulcanimicrobiaceae bacterium]